MAKRREPGQKEYNPLDDSRGRLAIDSDLIRAVTAPLPAVVPPDSPPAVASELQAAAAAPAPVPTVTEPRIEPRRTARALAIEKLTAYFFNDTATTEKLELDRLAARVSGAL